MSNDFTFDYTPPFTLKNFMLSDAIVRVVRGPVGSAKTTAMIMELLCRASQQKAGPDGIRRTRAVIVRNTYSQLRTTCLASILQLLRPIASWKPSEQSVTIRVGDIESEWLLMPLDTEDNIKKLLSLELSFAWLSECRELDPALIQDLLGRVGRFPSKMAGGCTWRGIIAETNSFTSDSGWFERLELDLPPNWEYFVQPGAFDPGAENRENLVDNYYEELMASNTQEWIDQYVHNKIGPSLSGQAVFKNSFNTDFHVSTTKLRPVPGHAICIGMDFARHPAAIIGQVDHQGRLLLFKEIEVENTGIEKFITTYLTPALQDPMFITNPIYIVGDPAGVAKGQIGEESVFSAIHRLGYLAFPASTNNITPRIRAVEKWFMQNSGGKPAIIIDAEGCPKLVRALRYEYRYKIKKNGQLEDQPDKKRPWADLCDALQYLCLGTAQNVRGKIMKRLNKGAVGSRPPVSARAWT